MSEAPEFPHSAEYWPVGVERGRPLAKDEVYALVHGAAEEYRAALEGYDALDKEAVWRRGFLPDPPALGGKFSNPLKKGQVATRPVEPVDPEGVLEVQQRELEVKRRAFLLEIVDQIIKGGVVWVRKCLTQAGYQTAEVTSLVNQATALIADDTARESLEHTKSVALRRYEDIYREARESLDLKVAIMALQQIDRIQGHREDTEGTSFTDLAELAALVSDNPQDAEKLVRQEFDRAAREEAEVVEVGEIEPREGIFPVG